MNEPPKDVMQHDEHLRAALRHAPDAGVGAPAALGAQIRAAAWRAAPAPSTRPPSSPPPWRHRMWAWLGRPGRMGASGAFATLLLAGVIGVVWFDDVPPAQVDERPDVLLSRSATAPRPSAAASRAEPAPQAPSAPRSNSPRAPARETGPVVSADKSRKAAPDDRSDRIARTEPIDRNDRNDRNASAVPASSAMSEALLAQRPAPPSAVVAPAPAEAQRAIRRSESRSESRDSSDRSGSSDGSDGSDRSAASSAVPPASPGGALMAATAPTPRGAPAAAAAPTASPAPPTADRAQGFERSRGFPSAVGSASLRNFDAWLDRSLADTGTPELLNELAAVTRGRWFPSAAPPRGTRAVALSNPGAQAATLTVGDDAVWGCLTTPVPRCQRAALAPDQAMRLRQLAEAPR